MFSDFTFYKDNFKGTKIKTENEYIYLGQQASRYILKYTNQVNDNTKSCECAISEYLQGILKQGNVSSETIPNAYSVTYKSDSNKNSDINSILELYLGELFSTVGIVKLI